MTGYSTAIKICGLRSPYIAEQAVRLGADYIGLVFHPPSPRHVDISGAQDIALAVKSAGGVPVAVVVQQSADEIQHICQRSNIDVVQLHGDTAIAHSHKLSPTLRQILVCPIGKSGELLTPLNVGTSHLSPEKDLLLFDGPRGGSGKTIVTHQLKQIAGAFKYFIAGGLNTHNVANILTTDKPYGVDVSSGVEHRRGHKDIALIKQFIDRVKHRSLSHVHS